MTNKEHQMMEELLLEYQKDGDTPEDLFDTYHLYCETPDLILQDYLEVFPVGIWSVDTPTTTVGELQDMLRGYARTCPLALNNQPIKETHLYVKDGVVYLNVGVSYA